MSRSAVCLTWPWPVSQRSFARGRERCLEAIAVAEAHGWATEPIVSVALATMGAADVWQGRFAEARPWLERAERALRPDLEPTTALLVHLTRGILHVGQGRLRTGACRIPRRRAVPDEARRAPRAGGPGPAVPGVHAAATGPDGGRPRDAGGAAGRGARLGRGARRGRRAPPGRGDAPAAIDVLAPVLGGAAPVLGEFTVIQALLLDAVARDRLGDAQAAEADVERALDLAEPDALIFPFVLMPARDLLERHRQHGTAHAALLADILDVLAGSSLPRRSRRTLGAARGPQRERAPRAPLPAEQPVRARDRRRALPLDQHGQDAHAAHLRQARRAPAHRGGRARPRARPARAVSRRHR